MRVLLLTLLFVSSICLVLQGSAVAADPDDQYWNALGTGMRIMDSMIAFTYFPQWVLDFETFGGQLVAGGGFDTAGGVAASNLAQWNGSAWQPLGGGTDRYVEALALYGGGLVAGGSFGGVHARTGAGPRTTSGAIGPTANAWRPCGSAGSPGSSAANVRLSQPLSAAPGFGIPLSSTSCPSKCERSRYGVATACTTVAWPAW